MDLTINKLKSCLHNLNNTYSQGSNSSLILWHCLMLILVLQYKYNRARIFLMMVLYIPSLKILINMVYSIKYYFPTTLIIIIYYYEDL